MFTYANCAISNDICVHLHIFQSSKTESDTDPGSKLLFGYANMVN